jgi:fucose permease
VATIFLLIIYLTFVSLGLPDALLGAAWPLMQPEFGVPVGFAGLGSMLIAGGTIVSSLLSGHIIERFGTGWVTLVSVAMTAAALLGFFWAPSFLWVVLFALPLGLGGGAVDSGLNGYVAQHYEAHHMSWLHCFWGVGAMTGPLIMSQAVAHGQPWRLGYAIVAAVQFSIVTALIFSLPLWRKTVEDETTAVAIDSPQSSRGLFAALRLRGVKAAMAALALYCAIEYSMNLWGSSYLVQVRGLDPATAAGWVAGFFGSLTLGRFLSGFLSMKLSNPTLIRWGGLGVLLGAGVLLLPLPSLFARLGMLVAGLGCAPIFPGILHETPVNFGRANAQRIMGFQMAAAYVGGTFLPPLFGLLASRTSMALLPSFLLGCGVVMLICSERLAAAHRNGR